MRPNLIIYFILMEIKNGNFGNLVLKYGLFLGLASVAFNALQYATGLLYTKSTMLNIFLWCLNGAIAIYFITTAVQQFKNENGNRLTVGEAIKVSVVVSAIAGVLFAAYYVLYTSVLDPQYYEKITEISVQKFENIFNEEQLDKMREQMLASKPSALMNFFSNFVSALVSGLIVGAIVGAVKKTKTDISL